MYSSTLPGAGRSSMVLPPIVCWSSCTPRLASSTDVLLDDGPGGAGEVCERPQMLRRGLAFGGSPRGFHGVPIIPVELDDRVPPGVLAPGIGYDGVLNVT